MIVRVQGGTGAGSKRPLRELDPRSWHCPSCLEINKPYHARCMTAGCNQKRP